MLLLDGATNPLRVQVDQVSMAAEAAKEAFAKAIATEGDHKVCRVS